MFEQHIQQARTRLDEAKLPPGTAFSGVLQFLQAVGMLNEGNVNEYEGPPVFFYPECVQDIPQIQEALIQGHVLAKHIKNGTYIPIRRNPGALSKALPNEAQVAPITSVK